jgi:lysyl-tRNA synthetase class 1
VHRQSVESSAGPARRTARPVSFRLLASVADITQGNREQIARIVSAHLDGSAPDPDTLLAELEPRLTCAIRFATEVVPEAERTRVRAEFARDAYESLDESMRRGVDLLAGGLASDWSLEGLTALVYAVPKTLQGLPADAEPSAEVKSAQRAFFKAVYRLLVDAETGPRLPTLLLSIGQDRARQLLAGA